MSQVALAPATAEAVKALAKSRKLSAPALLEAAQMALNMQAANNTRATRQAGPESTKFREAIVAAIDSLKGQTTTFANVAKQFGIDPANCVNNLKWLKKEGMIAYEIVGKGEKLAGQRGRAPMLIQFA